MRKIVQDRANPHYHSIQDKHKHLNQRLQTESLNIQRTPFKLPAINKKKRYGLSQSIQKYSNSINPESAITDSIVISMQRSYLNKRKNISSIHDRSREYSSLPMDQQTISICQISNSDVPDGQLITSHSKQKQKYQAFFDPIKYGIGQRDPPQKPINCQVPKNYLLSFQSTMAESKINLSYLSNSLPLKQETINQQKNQPQDNNKQKIIPLCNRYKIYMRNLNNNYKFPKLQVDREKQVMQKYPIKTKQQLFRQKMEQKIVSYSLHKKRHFQIKKGYSLSEKMKNELYEAKIKRQQYFIALNNKQGRKKLNRLLNQKSDLVLF